MPEPEPLPIPKRRGRRRIFADPSARKPISIQMSADMYARLAAEAERLGLNPTTYARMIIYRHIQGDKS